MRGYPKLSRRCGGAALVLLLSFTSAAQNKDSLLRVFPSVKGDFERVRLIYKILDNPDPQKGLHYHQALLNITRQQKDNTGEAAVTGLIGFAEILAGNSTTGMELLYKALHMAEQTRSKQVMGMVYSGLGILHFDDPPKQKQYFERALAESTAAKDYLFVCFALNNLSDHYYFQRKLDSALYYNQRSIEIATTHNIKEVLPISFKIAGDNNYKLGRKQLALEYYRTALAEPSIVNNIDLDDKGSIYGGLADYYTGEGHADSALYYARLQYETLKNLPFVYQMNPSYYLWKAYEKKNSDSALKYAVRYFTMRDSMFSAGKMQQIQTMAILEEDRQQNLEEQRNHSLQYAAIAMGLASLLIAFLVFSHTIIANPKLIRLLGVVTLLIVFEFLNLLLHPYLGKLTHHSPVLMLLIMVGVAAILVPIHHKLEHWITQKLVEKNNRIRLAAAKRTIQQLEGEKVVNNPSDTTPAH